MSDRDEVFYWTHGEAFCPVCQSTMVIEEIDFGTCDCCGYPDEEAEDFLEHDDDYDMWGQP